jgi:hypothetical protein
LQFVLLGTHNVAALLLPAVGSGSGPVFYRIKSE